MNEIRIKSTPKLEEDINKLKELYGEKTKSKIIKRAIESMLDKEGKIKILGDLKVEISELGLDIYNSEGKKICFFNKQGAESLFKLIGKWL